MVSASKPHDVRIRKRAKSKSMDEENKSEYIFPLHLLLDIKTDYHNDCLRQPSS
jgi:hypothetical protein